MGTHQAASHPVFVQGGLLESVILQASPTPLLGTSTPGSHSGPDPVLLRAVAAPDRQGVERDWERLLHMVPEKTPKINTNSSLWGSETAGLPAPLGYSNPLGFPV